MIYRYLTCTQILLVASLLYHRTSGLKIDEKQSGTVNQWAWEIWKKQSESVCSQSTLCSSSSSWWEGLFVKQACDLMMEINYDSNNGDNVRAVDMGVARGWPLWLGK